MHSCASKLILPSSVSTRAAVLQRIIDKVDDSSSVFCFTSLGVFLQRNSSPPCAINTKWPMWLSELRGGSTDKLNQPETLDHRPSCSAFPLLQQPDRQTAHGAPQPCDSHMHTHAHRHTVCNPPRICQRRKKKVSCTRSLSSVQWRCTRSERRGAAEDSEEIRKEEVMEESD